MCIIRFLNGTDQRDVFERVSWKIDRYKMISVGGGDYNQITEKYINRASMSHFSGTVQTEKLWVFAFSKQWETATKIVRVPLT